MFKWDVVCNPNLTRFVIILFSQKDLQTIMDIRESIKCSLCLASNNNIISNSTFKNLTENCFSVLKGNPEIHSMNNILGSKPNVIKQIYSALLSVSAEFVRQGVSEGEVSQYLNKECSFPQDKTKIYIDIYRSSRQDVEISLLNIGTHLPHITDADWKIDYVVKSNASDQSQGPLVRVALTTEVYDEGIQGKKLECVNFTCNTQELQDLVYKLKDAVRHCQHIAMEH